MLKYLLLMSLGLLYSSLGFGISLLTALDRSERSEDITLNLLRVDFDPTSQAAIAAVQRITDQELKEIRSSREVSSWSVASPRDRLAEYCIDQCGCINRHLIPLLGSEYNIRTLIIRSNRRASVSIRTQNGSIARYNNHIVSIIRIEDRWYVIDPIVLKSARPERLALWLQRIETPHLLTTRLEASH